VPDKVRQGLRSLFRRRNDLVKDFRRIKSQIKAQLLFEGIEIPEGMDTAKWTHRFRNWIKALEFENQTLLNSIQSRMKQYDFIDKQLRSVSNQLRAYCCKHYQKDYNLLRSLPGIAGNHTDAGERRSFGVSHIGARGNFKKENRNFGGVLIFRVYHIPTL